MEKYLFDIFPILLFLVFIFKVKPVKPFSGFYDDYLSRANTLMLKGAFAVTVILHHMSQEFDYLLLFKVYKIFGTYAVAMFFFYSGYGLMKSYMKNSNYKKQFLIRRLPTVLFPYLVMCAVYIIYKHFTGEELSIRSILYSFISDNPIVTYSWFILNILYFYIAFYISMLLLKKNYVSVALSCLLFCMLYVYVCKKLGLGSWNYMTSYIFVVGMFWCIYEKKILEITHKFYYPIGLFSVAVLVAVYFIPNEVFGKYIVIKTGLSDLFYVIMVILFTMKFTVGNKILAFLGSISLELYMLQGLMFHFFRGGFMYIKNDFLWCVAVLVSTIFASYIFHLFFSTVLKKYKSMLPQRQ